jgi:hypothetical protein
MTFPIVKATLDMEVAHKPETLALAFNIAEPGKEQIAGPLTFSIGYENDDENLANHLGLRMVGDRRFLVSVPIIKAGKKTITSNGARSYREKERHNYLTLYKTVESSTVNTICCNIQEFLVSSTDYS